MPMEPFELQGFHPPDHYIRKDRKGGGVSIYVRNSIPKVKVWTELEVEGFETKWVTVRPKLLPREFSILLLVAIYHPPDQAQGPMLSHLRLCLESVLQKHPEAGIILAGDTNHLNLSSICSGFNLRQIVLCRTRGENTLDKILIQIMICNMQ